MSFVRPASVATVVALLFLHCASFSGADAVTAADASTSGGGGSAGADGAAQADAGVAPSFVSYRQATVGNDTSLSTALPDGTVVGDVVVVVWVPAFANATPPAGWTSVGIPTLFGIPNTADALLWILTRQITNTAEMLVFTQPKVGAEAVTLLTFRGASPSLASLQSNALAPSSGAQITASGFPAKGARTLPLYVFASTADSPFPSAPANVVPLVPFSGGLAVLAGAGLSDGAMAKNVSIATSVPEGTVAVASFGVVSAP